jgi:hypothetical protein
MKGAVGLMGGALRPGDPDATDAERLGRPNSLEKKNLCGPKAYVDASVE